MPILLLDALVWAGILEFRPEPGYRYAKIVSEEFWKMTTEELEALINEYLTFKDE
jgi:hypothetical protein